MTIKFNCARFLLSLLLLTAGLVTLFTPTVNAQQNAVNAQRNATSTQQNAVNAQRNADNAQQTANAKQNAGIWNGKPAAVVLTYDDAVIDHLDTVIPVLDDHDLKGSFYVTINFDGFTDRVDDWTAITENGHELANHTLFHPCIRQGRDFVIDDYNLSTYSVDRIIDEAAVTNQVLALMDGKTSGRTFAYPCGNMTANGESYKEALEPHFVAARSTQQRVESFDTIDLYDIGTYVIRNHSAEEMIEMAENALAQNGLITYLFHGVGGDHSYNVDPAEHNALISWLKEHENEIWVTTLSEAAEYIRANR